MGLETPVSTSTTTVTAATRANAHLYDLLIRRLSPRSSVDERTLRGYAFAGNPCTTGST
jgi:hypothetical protein